MKKAKHIFHPLAFCSIHGVFPATVFAIGPHAQITFTNCVANCPVCNRTSEILSGTYKAGVDRINLLLDPGISKRALDELAAIARAARARQITTEEAKQAAEKVHPNAGRLFDVANWSDQAKVTLYAAIIGATAILGAAKMSSTGTTNIRMQPVIERVVTRERLDFRGSSSLSWPRNIPLPRPKPTKRR